MGIELTSNISQERQVPPILQNVALRFGSIHPFPSKLWMKRADRENAIDADEVDDDSPAEELLKPSDREGGRTATAAPQDKNGNLYSVAQIFLFRSRQGKRQMTQ